jgi:hypothetical protein
LRTQETGDIHALPPRRDCPARRHIGAADTHFHIGHRSGGHDQEKKKSSSDYSSEERKKIMELARQICRKKYGASSTVYRIDYTRKSVICVPPGY